MGQHLLLIGLADGFLQAEDHSVEGLIQIMEFPLAAGADLDIQIPLFYRVEGFYKTLQRFVHKGIQKQGKNQGSSNKDAEEQPDHPIKGLHLLFDGAFRQILDQVDLCGVKLPAEGRISLGFTGKLQDPGICGILLWQACQRGV